MALACTGFAGKESLFDAAGKLIFAEGVLSFVASAGKEKFSLDARIVWSAEDNCYLLAFPGVAGPEYSTHGENLGELLERAGEAAAVLREMDKGDRRGLSEVGVN